ncbi:response regulator [uncultured Xylophilus sp.]|uniref:response regulator n=1 Tax=uncultured Xylophilus sp. TaxID=296832 RepID=UPI0025D476E3|nr:response regulator [uncultured Xylophilus sp.]
MTAAPTLPNMLLVEPQFVMRRTMVTVGRELRIVDFQEATSVARAQALLESRRFGGLVLDMGDGPEALALLEQLRAGMFPSPADLPVIALTYVPPPAMVASRLAGFEPRHTLRKPFKVGELLESVAAIRAAG